MGLAEDHRAGMAQAFDDVRIACRRRRRCRHAAACRQSGDIEIVLD
jgi:hypothetical protein